MKLTSKDKEQLEEILLIIFNRPELLNYLKAQLIKNFFIELEKINDNR